MPLLVVDHPAHRTVLAAASGRVIGLAGHAAFETLSVVTRLPPPKRRTVGETLSALQDNFPATRHLSADAAVTLFGQLADRAIAGGAVYDALVGAAAREHDVLLLTRDARAANTYRSLGVTFELLT